MFQDPSQVHLQVNDGVNIQGSSPTVVHEEIDKSLRGSIMRPISDKNRVRVRFILFVTCLSFLFLGRSTIPDHDVKQIDDRLMDLFDGINEYIRQNQTLQDAMLIICSLFMDIMFFSTGFYWVFKGKSSRLVVTTLSFYLLRIAVQHMWYSPYPTHYVWNDPGFPSLVVPYGRTSDFYFSGHMGIVTICASEWFKYKKYWVSALIALGGVYTTFIMLAYQAHYSIDIFTGIICGSWMFMIVDQHKGAVDSFLYKVLALIKRPFTKNSSADAEVRQSLL